MLIHGWTRLNQPPPRLFALARRTTSTPISRVGGLILLHFTKYFKGLSRESEILFQPNYSQSGGQSKIRPLLRIRGAKRFRHGCGCSTALKPREPTGESALDLMSARCCDAAIALRFSQSCDRL